MSHPSTPPYDAPCTSTTPTLEDAGDCTRCKEAQKEASKKQLETLQRIEDIRQDIRIHMADQARERDTELKVASFLVVFVTVVFLFVAADCVKQVKEIRQGLEADIKKIAEDIETLEEDLDENNRHAYELSALLRDRLRKVLEALPRITISYGSAPADVGKDTAREVGARDSAVKSSPAEPSVASSPAGPSMAAVEASRLADAVTYSFFGKKESASVRKILSEVSVEYAGRFKLHSLGSKNQFEDLFVKICLGVNPGVDEDGYMHHFRMSASTFIHSRSEVYNARAWKIDYGWEDLFHETVHGPLFTNLRKCESIRAEYRLYR